MLTRDTDWRQGDLLTLDAAAKLTALNGAIGETHRIASSSLRTIATSRMTGKPR